MRTQCETSRLEAQENMSDQDVVDFSFASDWLERINKNQSRQRKILQGANENSE